MSIFLRLYNTHVQIHTQSKEQAIIIAIWNNIQLTFEQHEFELHSPIYMTAICKKNHHKQSQKTNK